ncbi:hypothetical protein [Kamptonema formosum]|nr:hypothetical protein [Oscillatoria sp. PCC 10802]
MHTAIISPAVPKNQQGALLTHPAAGNRHLILALVINQGEGLGAGHLG